MYEVMNVITKIIFIGTPPPPPTPPKKKKKTTTKNKTSPQTNYHKTNKTKIIFKNIIFIVTKCLRNLSPCLSEGRI